MLRVCHFQLECQTGRIERNVERVVEHMRMAHERDVDIAMFPESILTGYFADGAKAREVSFPTDSDIVKRLLKATASFSPTFIAGFNEQRGDQLFNTMLVAERGRLLGTYSKAFPIFDYFTPGREFPVFQRKGVKFGVIICADGGYIEPARIEAIKGARVIFAPHYNYVPIEAAINHFIRVRHDHVARAVENNVWFFRGNNVVSDFDEGLCCPGIGYGDSYLLDPNGEIVARSQRHVECMVETDIHLDRWQHRPERSASVRSALALGDVMMEAARQRNQQ